MPFAEDIMGEPDDSPSTYIYLCRHGETALNAEHKMRGWDDPDINGAGRKDAEEIAKAMKDVPLDSVFCSDLWRAVTTAEIITKLPPKKMQLLRTIDVGAWTGQSLKSVEPALGRLETEWETKPDTPAPHGESWNDFQGRQIAAWRKIIGSPGKHILVVAHLRCSVWALCYALLDMKPIQGADLRMLDRITQSTGRISTFSYSRKDGLGILAVNAQEPETY
jgi:probable phosphoglycerate mutase